MHIGFDISQTGSGKAGCGFFSEAMIQGLLKLAAEHSALDARPNALDKLPAESFWLNVTYIL